MFGGLEESTIAAGTFTAQGDSTMFEESKNLAIDGGSFLSTAERKGTESDSEDDGPQMFKGLQQSTLTNGKFVSEGGGKMFEKSSDLLIDGGEYISTGKGRKPRKSKNTAKPFQQGYGLAQQSELWGSSSSVPAPYNPTAIHQPLLQPQSVPAASNGSSYQGGATFGASVTLTHTQTAPALSSERRDYFPQYDVPNHRMEQAPTKVVQGPSSAGVPMNVDVNNETSSAVDNGKGKKKHNKFAQIWKKQE